MVNVHALQHHETEMTNRVAGKPSPVRSALLHLSGSLLAFAVTLSAGAGLIHLFGNEEAAGPSLRVALFAPDDSEDVQLKSRLASDDPSFAGLPLARDESAASAARMTEQAYEEDSGDAPFRPGMTEFAGDEPRLGVRINGQDVLPGQSLSEVSRRASERTGDVGSPLDLAADTPFGKFARVFENPENSPTVSIIVGGLGINWARSVSAIEELPPEVTLSFAPTAPNLSSWIQRARAAGHEVLIELPMEPYDYGRARPHAQMLRVNASASQNVRNLGILLARASDYAGVINFQGDHFATRAEALTPVFASLRERGLAFFGGGNLTGSELATVAQAENLIFGQADTAIDARPEAAEIESALLLLEAEALEHGASLGTAMPFPITVDLLNAWFERLDQQGIVLAPASHFARQAVTSGQIKVAELNPQG